MRFQRHIEKKDDYLLVRYSGKLTSDNLPQDFPSLEQLVDHCTKQECKKALLDTRELSADIDFFDLYDVGLQFGKIRGERVKFAILAGKKEISTDGNFIEDVAVNNGASIKFFTIKEKAIGWLND